MREHILKLLETNEDLPSLPEILFRLRILLKDPDASLRDIVKLIEIEPVLAGKILTISNSTFYAQNAKPITSLSTAITKIGFKTLSKIVYSLKLTMLFSESDVMDSRKFWRHSLAVAVFTQALARRVRVSPSEQEIAYFAGLMHDVGFMVFGFLIPREYTAFLKEAVKIEEAIQTQEVRAFNIDHAEIGSLFIERWWKMEKGIIDSVRNHHMPFQSSPEERRIAELINISNGICNNQGITNGINTYKEIFKEGAWEELGLSISDAEEIMADVRTSLAEAQEFLGASSTR